MDLKSLSKQTLLADTEKLVQEERRITTAILWHLHEIERRRLFAELGFGSLFEYCVEHLKYSGGSAQRRIASMRLLREMPEIEPKINSGELNVSAIAQAQSVFRQARIEKKAFTFEAKKELIKRLENKSHRECEKILAEVNPVEHRPSKERLVAANRAEVRFEMNEELYAKVQALKARYAHRLKGSGDFADLLEILVDQALKANEPLPALEVNAKPNRNSPSLNSDGSRAPSQSRYIPKAIRMSALACAKNQCTYVDPKTKRRCSSRFALEFDHIKPLALGGKTEAANIRILCRSHNQYMAIQKLGLKVMERHLNGS